MSQIPAGPLRFRKMHGLGNDFVIIDARGGPDPVTPALARALGDRHRGVGFDQLAVIGKAADATASVFFWNSDGTHAGACGNATRCVASLLMDETGLSHVSLRAPDRILRCARRADGQITADMGAAAFGWERVPLAGPADTLRLPVEGTPVALSMGNPHCVFFVPDVAAVPLAEVGPRWEHHPIFPARANIEFVELVAPDTLRVRVWERGAGITLACGSGACAVAAAARARGLTGSRVRVVLDGGALEIEVSAEGPILMTGPVAQVFEAALSPAFLAAHGIALPGPVPAGSEP